MDHQTSIERRLILTLMVIAGIAIAGVLAILPYRLYSRDIQQATTDAHRISSIVHVALSHALMQEEMDEVALTDLVNRLQGMGNVDVRLRRLPATELHPAASSGRGTSSRRDTELVYVAPPITDLNGATWLATMEFDLSSMKKRSIALIIDLVLAVAIGSLAFSGVIFLLIRRGLLQPIQAVTERIGEFAEEADPNGHIELPDFATSEMSTLAHQVERACAMRRPT